jgi:DnaJ-class molecular chaperone
MDNLTCSRCDGEGYQIGGQQGHKWYRLCLNCNGYGYVNTNQRKPGVTNNGVRITKTFTPPAKVKYESKDRVFLESVRQGLMTLAADIDRELGG